MRIWVVFRITLWIKLWITLWIYEPLRAIPRVRSKLAAAVSAMARLWRAHWGNGRLKWLHGPHGSKLRFDGKHGRWQLLQ